MRYFVLSFIFSEFFSGSVIFNSKKIASTRSSEGGKNFIFL